MKRILMLLLLVLPFSFCGQKTWRVSPVEGDATENIQRALDACFLAGGGKVIIKRGIYHIGGLRLRSNTCLYLKKGAELYGSRDCDAYCILDREQLEMPDSCDLAGDGVPWIPPRARLDGKAIHFSKAWSRWNNAVIRIYKADNVSIIGEEGSVIDGCNSYDPSGEEYFRGVHGISAIKCRNLVFKGYTIRHTGNWAHIIRNCEDVVISGLEILGGHDGIHMNTCDRVSISECVIKSGDDCIAGFDNRDMTVRGCRLSSACSAFRWGGTRLLAQDCICEGPCEYVARGTLTKEERAEGAMTGTKARTTMLGLFTYYADKTVPIRETPDEIRFVNIICRNAERFMHYNMSGSETWQLERPLASVSFENVEASGLKFPVCAYGTVEQPLSLSFRECSLSFHPDVQEFLRGAYIGRISIDGLHVEGVSGPFYLQWQDMAPETEISGLSGIQAGIKAADEPFKVRRI